MTIPYNLNECFEELKVILCEKDLNDFTSDTEEKVVTWHNNLGRWIRNNWGLWEGGPLKDYFQSLELHHPDDMSGVILTSFHRHLNNKPIELEEQIKEYLEFWANQNV